MDDKENEGMYENKRLRELTQDAEGKAKAE